MIKRDDKVVCSRRRFLGGTVAAVAFGAATGLVPLPWAIRRAAAQPAGTTGTRLVLLGTQGGPNITATRSETASAVVADGHTYLVDCGYGTLAALVRAGLPFRDVAEIFLTHLHDDHTADLAALLSHQWTDGRTETTSIYGPVGTQRLVRAAVDFEAVNAAIRLVDEHRSVKPADIVKATEIAATSSPAKVYTDERVKVTSIENTHYPESSKQRMPYRSLAYRFDARDRSIAFAGDTNYSTGVVELAKGVDVLVCEVIELRSMRRAFEARVARGAYADNSEGIWKHIVDTHASPESVGRMAAEAGVGMLVLNHLAPGAVAEEPDASYTEGVRKHFRGKVVVGRDLMVL